MLILQIVIKNCLRCGFNLIFKKDDIGRAIRITICTMMFVVKWRKLLKTERQTRKKYNIIIVLYNRTHNSLSK